MSREGSVNLFVFVFCFVTSYFNSHFWLTSGLGRLDMFFGLLFTSVLLGGVCAGLSKLLKGKE